MTQKVYVVGYRALEDEEITQPTRTFERLENVGVGYTSEPEWTIPDRYLAERECETLRGMGVHIGTHYCDFAVESLDRGGFAVVCLSHPTELRLAQPNARNTTSAD